MKPKFGGIRKPDKLEINIYTVEVILQWNYTFFFLEGLQDVCECHKKSGVQGHGSYC